MIEGQVTLLRIVYINGPYLHKAVVRRKIVSHRVPPALVVSFKEWKQSADLLQNLKRKQHCHIRNGLNLFLSFSWENKSSKHPNLTEVV